METSKINIINQNALAILNGIEQAGLIVLPKNKEALKKAMLWIMEDKNLTQKMAGNSRESIVSRFDQLTLWKLIKEEYDEQLAKASPDNFRVQK